MRMLARLCILHPDWSATRLMKEAGYAPKTARASTNTFSRPGMQLLLTDERSAFKRAFRAKLSLDHAIDIIVDIAEHSRSPFARLKAIDRAFEHCGWIEPKDRVTIVNTVIQNYNTQVMGILQDILTVEQGKQFMARVAQAIGKTDILPFPYRGG
jgi:hypothetical protein